MVGVAGRKGAGFDKPACEWWVWLATSGRKGAGFDRPGFEWWVWLVGRGRSLISQHLSGGCSW